MIENDVKVAAPGAAAALLLDGHGNVPGPVPVLLVLCDPPGVEVRLDGLGPQPEELAIRVGLQAVALEEHPLRPKLGYGPLVPEMGEGGERGKEDREKVTERYRDSKTARQRDRETERQRARETEGQRDNEIERQSGTRA